MRMLFIITLAMLFFWGAGLVYFVRAIPRQPVGDSVSTDAIVVLTGGSLRITYGFELLAKGKAQTLFISGVSEEADLASLMQEHNAPSALFGWPDLNEKILLDHQADSTWTNARETAKWARLAGVRSVRLVTANYHLPRSLIEFQQAMPNITIIPDPVFPEPFTLDNWWRDEVSRSLILSEYHKYLMVWVRSLITAPNQGLA